jgi:hypothetical protein
MFLFCSTRSFFPPLLTSEASRPAPEPQLGPRLVARLDAGRDKDVERLGLLQRIDGVVADPGELEVKLVHRDLDQVIERVLDPVVEPFND